MKKSSETIHICIASDNNYAPLVATTIASTCINTQRFVKFWCLESGISDFNKKIINTLHDKFDNFEIEYITIDHKLIHEFAQKISTSGHITADTYSRLYIPDLFPQLEKMIYLDVDLIVTGDIGQIYDIDLGRYSLAAVAADYGVDKSKWFANMEMSNAHHYFNAGVLLLNPKELHEENFLTGISEIANKFGKYIILGDQDLLNKYFNAQYLELPWRFNLTTRFIEMELAHRDPQHREQMQEEYKNCVIRHFESRKKPWNAVRNECNGAPIKNMAEFWTTAALTPYRDWFMSQFNTSMLLLTQGNIWRYINENHQTSAVDATKRSWRLFGFLPILSIRRKTNKIKYNLFGFIPLFSSANRKGGKKRVYKLFDLITIFSVKYKK